MAVTRSNPAAPPRAFTLLEMVVSLTIVSILMLAMGSSILLVTRALPDGGAAADETTRRQAALDQLADELRYALHFTERTSTSIGFTVADRDGDGSPEHIRYAWAGAGSPLTRTYNHGSANPVIDAVAAFTLTYDTKATNETYAGPLVEKDSDDLIQYIDPPLPSLSNEHVSNSRSVGQWIQPVFADPNVELYRVTSVSFPAKQPSGLLASLLGALLGNSKIQVFAAQANGTPTGPPLASSSLANLLSTLKTWQTWQTIPLNTPKLDSSQVICLTISGDSTFLAPRSMEVGVLTSGQMPGGFLVDANDTGAWSVKDSMTMPYSLKCRVSVRQPDQSLARTHVTGVGVELTGGERGAAPLRTGVQTVAAPQDLVAYWHTDFDADPIATDSNGDNQNDWVVRSGSFSLGDLLGGLLGVSAPQVLDSRPLHDFTQPITIDARFRSADSGADTSLRINADYADGRAAPLIATLHNAGATQTLTLRNRDSDSGEALLSLHGLDDGFVELRLLIDPTRDTVHVAVNGQPVETYRYERVPLSDPTHRVVSLISEEGSEWDRVTVRAGGTPK